MNVKSFMYARTWTGKYYRQRLFPSMQAMDKHITSMSDNGWEIMRESSHSGRDGGSHEQSRLGRKRSQVRTRLRQRLPLTFRPRPTKRTPLTFTRAQLS